ncbi:hypothetical protein F909_03892 [Acinetobacter sp. ANC 3929]|uniref:hypothetical protein n=1 Tax=Acinetobacter sp. ANC 3929 TaxID=1217707 RepID=UPI0002CDBD81|nr:hypothetical protein [Acinetobacter sp. ANC 3929]ENW78206.1 hypothetical protein F909_03892 [Acinetobacter sp. ANC 3929]
MTIAIPEFRQQTCVALISAGITQQAQIISTVAALEKFVFNLDEYAGKTSNPEVKNAETEKASNKKNNAAVEAQKAADESAEKVAEAASAEQVEETAATETETVSEEAVNKITKDDVTKAMIGLGKKHGRKAIASVLEQVGAENMSGVAEADYLKVIQLVEGYAA